MTALRADDPGRAGAIFDHGRTLAESLAELQRQEPRHHVESATGRDRHHKMHRLVRIVRPHPGANPASSSRARGGPPATFASVHHSGFSYCQEAFATAQARGRRLWSTDAAIRHGPGSSCWLSCSQLSFSQARAQGRRGRSAARAGGGRLGQRETCSGSNCSGSGYADAFRNPQV